MKNLLILLEIIYFFVNNDGMILLVFLIAFYLWINIYSVSSCKILLDIKTSGNLKYIKQKSAMSSIIEYKLRKFAGKYEKIDSKNINLVIYDFSVIKDENLKHEFISQLSKIKDQEYISPIDISSIAYQLGVKIDWKILWTLLLRNSNSIHRINGELLESYLLPLLKTCLLKTSLTPNIINKRSSKIKQSEAKDKDKHTQRKSSEKSDQNEKNEKQQGLMFKIADALFNKNKSLMDIIHSRIYDRVIDGKEYQLIRRSSFINWMNKVGVNFSLEDQIHLTNILPLTINDLWDTEGIKMILDTLGIKEDIPPPNKNLDFSKLQPNSIRIFNKIIAYVQENKIDYIDDFIGKKNIEQISIISKTKEHKIETITANKLREVLREKQIIDYGEDLDENFVEFLEVNPKYENIIMISKLK